MENGREVKRGKKKSPAVAEDFPLNLNQNS
jgi:hypothetical protein